MRLGRKPHDPDRLAAVTPHVTAAGEAPPAAVLVPGGFQPELLHNDILPVCTDAGLINSARLWFMKFEHYDPAYDVQTLLQFYADCVGCTVDEIEAAISQLAAGRLCPRAGMVHGA